MTTTEIGYTENQEEMIATLEKLVAAAEAGRLQEAEIKVFYKDGTSTTFKIGSNNSLSDAIN